MVEDPLSEKILWKEFHAGETIVVDADGDEIVFRAIEGVEPPPVELAGSRLRGFRLEPLDHHTADVPRRALVTRPAPRPARVLRRAARRGRSRPGAKVDATIDVRVHEDGSGVVRLLVDADAEAVKAAESGGVPLEQAVPPR